MWKGRKQSKSESRRRIFLTIINFSLCPVYISLVFNQRTPLQGGTHLNLYNLIYWNWNHNLHINWSQFEEMETKPFCLFIPVLIFRKAINHIIGMCVNMRLCFILFWLYLCIGYFCHLSLLYVLWQCVVWYQGPYIKDVNSCQYCDKCINNVWVKYKINLIPNHPCLHLWSAGINATFLSIAMHMAQNHAKNSI